MDMDVVTPAKIVGMMIELGAAKTRLRVTELLVRSALAGALLCVSVTLAFTAIAQTNVPVVGALIFPVGFSMIVVLGLDLVTGSFAIMPVALMAGRATIRQVIVNWGVTFIGNLIGSLLIASFMYVVWTNAGHESGGVAAEKLKAVVTSRSAGYAALGVAGITIAFVKAMLCNWMVSLGVVMAICSSNVVGKVVGCWLPIVIFFAQGFEHTVVNMSLFPLGIMLGAGTTVGQFLLVNELPVTIGNIIGGYFLTGLALYLAYPQHNNEGTSLKLGVVAAE